jgi:hypothetical protein
MFLVPSNRRQNVFCAGCEDQLLTQPYQTFLIGELEEATGKVLGASVLSWDSAGILSIPHPLRPRSDEKEIGHISDGASTRLVKLYLLADRAVFEQALRLELIINFSVCG